MSVLIWCLIVITAIMLAYNVTAIVIKTKEAVVEKDVLYMWMLYNAIILGYMGLVICTCYFVSIKTLNITPNIFWATFIPSSNTKLFLFLIVAILIFFTFIKKHLQQNEYGVIENNDLLKLLKLYSLVMGSLYIFLLFSFRSMSKKV